MAKIPSIRKKTASNNTSKGNAANSGPRTIIKHIILSGCSVLVFVFILVTFLKVITRHNQELSVPSFINMTVEQAQELAKEHELRLEVTDSVYINRMAPGAIFRQNPEADGKVKKNRRILLTINATQPKMISMPSLVGYSLRQAQSELVSSQLTLGKLVYEEDIASNNVLGQMYNGREIEPGEKIPSESIIDLKLGINDTDSTTYVPDLGMVPYRLVRERLAESSLNLKRAVFDESVKDYSDSISAWVYRQEPERNDTVSVRLGTAVTVYLSKVQKPVVKEVEIEEE